MAHEQGCQNLLDHPRGDDQDKGVRGDAEDLDREEMDVQEKNGDLCHRLSDGPAYDDSKHGLPR